MVKHAHTQVIVLIITLMLYISFCLFYVFSNQYFISDFNIRISSLVVEVIVFVSLLHSLSSRKVKDYFFWMPITFSVGCFLIGNFISIFQIFNIELKIENFTMSDIFLLLFLCFLLFSFLYKITKNINRWERAFFLCDFCIVVITIFTFEWYLFNKPTVNILSLSIGDIFLSFVFPIIDILLLLLGISLIFLPAIFKTKRELYLFIIVLIGLAITDYFYFNLQGDLFNQSILALRCSYRVLLLLIAIAATIQNSIPCGRGHFIINPIFGKKLLTIIPYLTVTILSGFTFKEQNTSAILTTGNYIVFIFILVRHTLVQIQNNDLNRKLKIFNNQLEKEITLRTKDLINKTHDLLKKQQKFKSLYEYHPDPILTMDLKGRVLNINQAGSVLLGKTSNELIGKDFFFIFLDKDKSALETALKQVARCNSTSLQLCVKNNNDKDINFWYMTMVPIRIEGQSFGSYVIIKDITKMKQQQAKINYLAFHDIITEIGNRIFFQKELENYIKIARENQGEFGLLYIDLNRFKNINDTLGHSIGDSILKEVARRFRECLSSTIPLARIGGDEFAILVQNYTEQQLLYLCEKLFCITKMPFVVNNRSFYLSLSIGIAVYPFGGTNATTLLQNADIAMYDAKRKDSNAACIYNKILSERITRRFRLKQDLPNAIENNELFLLYQPQIHSQTNIIVGVEALIRWQHPELGLISPDEFIPIAEETSHIILIGKWTLLEACRQLKKWHSVGYSNIKMGINLSAIEFEQKNFVQTIISILEATGVAASSIDLELTERIAMVDEEETLFKLKELKTLGIHLSIDDFGTGYSSLAYLPLYPIDTLKIPREFIKRIGTSNDGNEIIKTIISLAQTLKIKVIAEGVETKEQLEMLQQNQCYLIQGFYYSKPLKESEFINFLNTSI